MNLIGLVGLDVRDAVDDATADLEIGRALAEPAPAFERSGAQGPAARQLGAALACRSWQDLFILYGTGVCGGQTGAAFRFGLEGTMD